MRVVLTVVKIAVAVAVVVAAVQMGRHLARPPAVVPQTPAVEQSLGGTVNVDSIRAVRAAILRHIGSVDSYLPAMLAQSDSLLKRWPDRSVRPLTVFLAASTVRGYGPEMREAARAAFVRWERVGAIPVRFAFVSDSAAAEVRVRWIERFPMRRAGQADISWNQRGWIVRGTLTLATHTTAGLPLDADAVHTVAMHEIGHLLGLGHSDDPHDVMYPSTEVHDITARDRQTARLLYSVPPGSLRLGRRGR
jgi:hypothetical protein